MADGLNERRAIRVAELMNDFRTLQLHLAQPKAQATSSEDYHEEGYAILRQCSADARAVLAAHFAIGVPSGQTTDEEREKLELQRVMLDASVRRFQAQKIYLRAAAASRWAQARAAILMGMKPHAGHVPALHAADSALRMEMAVITDEAVLNSLRHTDYQHGRWMQEDPPLATINSWLSSLS
ncbi:MAG: hypothetical protein M1829_002259 [Trizodia sp. TS-e1964]|nr:MAG: hypothetical protein M1829_002259 [Trizodia sp. TS-e1964]